MFPRAGRLSLVTGEGAESSSGETHLFEEASGVFRIGEEPTPERLRFHDVVDGQALRADWSGHVFFRKTPELPPRDGQDAVCIATLRSTVRRMPSVSSLGYAATRRLLGDACLPTPRWMRGRPAHTL